MYFTKFNNTVLTYFIISIHLFTLWFSFNESPFEYTLSKIGNLFDYKLKFIVWGLITGILLFITIYNIYKKYNYHDKKSFKFLLFSILFLVLTVLTPTIDNTFVENDYEFVDYEIKNTSFFNFHNIFAFLFSLFLMFSLFLFSKYLSSYNKKIYLKSFNWFLITLGGSLLMLFLFGFTGIFELFFFISLSVFLLILNLFK